MVRWVIFEGIDGSGKSTMAHWLYNVCRGVLPSVMHISETGLGGGVGVSDRLQSQLVRRAIGQLDPYRALIYFLAARLSIPSSYPFHDNYDDDLLVVRDRCFISSFVYQATRLMDGLFSDLDSACVREVLYRLCESSELVHPSDRVLCVILDVDPEIAWRRTSKLLVGDCYDRSLDEMRLTRQHYLSFVDEFSDRLPNWDFCVLDASLDLPDLSSVVFDVFNAWLRGESSHGQGFVVGQGSSLSGADRGG